MQIHFNAREEKQVLVSISVPGSIPSVLAESVGASTVTPENITFLKR